MPFPVGATRFKRCLFGVSVKIAGDRVTRFSLPVQLGKAPLRIELKASRLQRSRGQDKTFDPSRFRC